MGAGPRVPPACTVSRSLLTRYAWAPFPSSSLLYLVPETRLWVAACSLEPAQGRTFSATLLTQHLFSKQRGAPVCQAPDGH